MAAAVDISDLPAPPSATDISDLPAPPPQQIPGHLPPVTTGEDPLAYTGRAIAGAGEAALSGITGGLGSLADVVTGSDPGTHDWAYRPRTQAGQEITGGLGAAAGAVNTAAAKGGGAVVGALGGNQQAATDEIASRLPEAEGAIGTVTTAGGLLKGGLAPKVLPDEVVSTAQDAANRAASSGNAGAAGTAVDVTKLTPETQAELAKIGADGGTPNATALARHNDAETLPVPVRLTAGQASGDAAQISDEFNRKGQENNAIGNRYNDQDQALQDNLSEIHREAAPNAVGNDDIQNGQAIIDSLKRYDQPKVAAITSAYSDANQANIAAGKGGLTLDPAPAVAHATDALEDRMDLLPSEGQSILAKLQAAQDNDASIPLKQAETWRTTVASATRKYDQAGDTNAVRALSDFRDSLEQMTPDNAATSDVAAKFTAARGLAKARFDEMDADPAYEAAANDDTPIDRLSPLADNFTQKYVLNGAKADLQQLRPKLDQDGGEAMTSASMNYLKSRAGLDKGKFQQNGYNTALNKLGPKADELFGDPDVEEQLKQVGRVANYTQAQTRGGYANTSHTFVAAAAEHAAGVAEGVANVKAGGLPVGTIARRFLAGRSNAAAIRNALKPGAGLED